MKELIWLLIFFLVGCGTIADPGVEFTTAATCSVLGIPGGALIRCPDGSQQIVLNGPIGPIGPTGATGETGLTGSQGEQGNPGTQVTPIQLCPTSFVPSYPSTFPEYGLCIGNQLYGVYSANDGFLALLPPGTYSSNGINASCTLTIGANCEVH